MTGNKMFQIVKQKHKENAAKESKENKKEACVKEAIAKFKQEQRRESKKKLQPKKIKSNPRL